MIRRFLRPALGALAVMAIAVGAWAYFQFRPVTVEVASVEQDVPVQVFGLGTVEARIVSQIGFEASGALVELNADHGDRVERGTVLARLYSAEEAARVAKAEAALAQAQANLQRARARVVSAEALLVQKRSISDRRQALVGRGVTSEEAAEDARAATDIAAAELAVARSNVAVAEAAIKDAQAQVQIETVLLNNHVLRTPYDALVISRRIFQWHNLLPFLDAVDNVAVVLDLAGVERSAARRRAQELLEYLDIGRRRDAMPANLSGGEAQRVAIARAMANEPRIILADEPTAALDSQRAGIVMDLLRRVARERKAAIIVVTHDEKVFDRFDLIVRLRDGRLEGQGASITAEARA